MTEGADRFSPGASPTYPKKIGTDQDFKIIEEASATEKGGAQVEFREHQAHPVLDRGRTLAVAVIGAIRGDGHKKQILEEILGLMNIDAGRK